MIWTVVHDREPHCKTVTLEERIKWLLITEDHGWPFCIVNTKPLTSTIQWYAEALQPSLRQIVTLAVCSNTFSPVVNKAWERLTLLFVDTIESPPISLVARLVDKLVGDGLVLNQYSLPSDYDINNNGDGQSSYNDNKTLTVY